MTNKTTNPKAVKVALAERGLHQYELAARVGVSPTRLSDLLHGRLNHEVAVHLRGRIEATLGLAPGALAIDETA